MKISIFIILVVVSAIVKSQIYIDKLSPDIIISERIQLLEKIVVYGCSYNIDVEYAISKNDTISSIMIYSSCEGGEYQVRIDTTDAKRLIELMTYTKNFKSMLFEKPSMITTYYITEFLDFQIERNKASLIYNITMSGSSIYVNTIRLNDETATVFYSALEDCIREIRHPSIITKWP